MSESCNVCGIPSDGNDVEICNDNLARCQACRTNAGIGILCPCCGIPLDDGRQWSGVAWICPDCDGDDHLQQLRPGAVVGLRYKGKILHQVKVVCFNHPKARYEAMVELVDMTGVSHAVPLTFEPGDVVTP